MFEGVLEQTNPVLEPPWCIKPVYIDFSLSNLIRKSDPPESIKAFSLERIDSYANSLCIYTDGSKNQSGQVGCSFCVPNLNIECSTRLSDNLSVYTAELIAIKLSVEWVLAGERGGSIEANKSIVIFSDSLSSLQSLDSQQSGSRPNLINEVLTILKEVKSQLSIVWIPGHSGIKGNDCADRLAKESLQKPAVDIIVSNEAKEAYEAVDNYILQKWQEQWDNLLTGKLNRRIVPLVSQKSKYSSNSRYKEVNISRFRLGKCRLNYYLNVMNSHPTGLCDTCKVPETIEHYLLKCQNSNVCVLLQDKCNRLGIKMDLESILNNEELCDVIHSNNKRDL